MAEYLTASDVRSITKRIVERMTAPVDWEAEKRFKNEWVRRFDMAVRGKIEVHPFVGLMANWKDPGKRKL